jgi:hypothetical protein
MNHRKELTGEFSAFDETGNRYSIYEYTEIIEAPVFGNPHDWEPGLKEYCLNDGSPVNRLSDREFQIVGTRLKIYVSSSS